MRISARTVLKGKVIKYDQGAVNAEVVIQLPGGDEIVSIITKGAAAKLGIDVGKKAYAIIKASNVMVGVDE